MSSIFRWSKKRHEHVETGNKTIVICPDSTIKKLETDFPNLFKDQIENYDWETFPHHNANDGETTNFHISGLPNDFQEEDAVEYITSQTSCIIKPSHYKLVVKLRSRTTGEINGWLDIVFNDDVPLHLRNLFKLMLHNKPIVTKFGHKTMMVQCRWYKVVAPESEPHYKPKPQRMNDKGKEKSRGYESDRKSSGSRPYRKFNNFRPIKVDVSAVGVISNITEADPVGQSSVRGSTN